jgi:hypothetical protein
MKKPFPGPAQMNLIGSKGDLVARWQSQADSIREKKVKSKKEEDLNRAVAMAIEQCANELAMLKED